MYYIYYIINYIFLYITTRILNWLLYSILYVLYTIIHMELPLFPYIEKYKHQRFQYGKMYIYIFQYVPIKYLLFRRGSFVHTC